MSKGARKGNPWNKECSEARRVENRRRRHIHHHIVRSTLREANTASLEEVQPNFPLFHGTEGWMTW